MKILGPFLICLGVFLYVLTTNPLFWALIEKALQP